MIPRPISQMRMMLLHAMILPDKGGYTVGIGEMNPEIVWEFSRLINSRKLHPVLWGPCAGHTGRSRSQDTCAAAKIRLISYDLQPSDWRVQCMDSTKVGPDEEIGGMIFHPPYFGCIPFSDHEGEISQKGRLSYIEELNKIVTNCKNAMKPGGLVCAVGRDYQMHGKPIRLSEWYTELFVLAGFELETAWTTLPDFVLIFRRLT